MSGGGIAEFNLAPSQLECPHIFTSQSCPVFPPPLTLLCSTITILILACFAQTMNNGSDQKGRSAATVVQALSTVLLGLTSFCNYFFPPQPPMTMYSPKLQNSND